MNIKKLELHMKPIKVNALKCQDCKDTIFSRANHDYRTCSCGKIAIDGGFSRYGGHRSFADKLPIEVELILDVSKAELYDDYNYSKDKYGVIKDE